MFSYIDLKPTTIRDFNSQHPTSRYYPNCAYNLQMLRYTREALSVTVVSPSYHRYCETSLPIILLEDCGCLLETVFFYFQTNRERKIDNKKFGRKKGFLSFYSVCMFVYMCICVFVCLLALYRRHRLTKEAEILT